MSHLSAVVETLVGVPATALIAYWAYPYHVAIRNKRRQCQAILLAERTERDRLDLKKFSEEFQRPARFEFDNTNDLYVEPEWRDLIKMAMGYRVRVRITVMTERHPGHMMYVPDKEIVR